MMKINDVFSRLSDEEILQGVKQIEEDKEIRMVRKNGIVRMLCDKIYDLTGEHASTHIFLVKESILKEYASRFK